MSYPISRHEQEISVAANSRYTLPLGNADYIRFHTVPAGVMVRLNGGSAGAFIQGETHQGEPGTGELREVSFENTTGGALSVRVIFGLGRIEVTGVATITGAVPLPSDAAQASKQDSIIGVLTSLVSIVSTATLQSAGNTILSAIQTALATANSYLSTLANSTASLSGGRTPRVASLTAGATFSVIYARELSVLNTHSSLNLTVRISGQTDFVLTPGRGVSWPLLDRRDSYAPIDIDCPASGSGTVSYVL